MRIFPKLFVVALALAIAAVAPALAQDTPRVGVVVKIGGIPWFNSMEAGIKARGDELGIDAFMIGPTSADPALQVRAGRRCNRCRAERCRGAGTGVGAGA